MSQFIYSLFTPILPIDTCLDVPKRKYTKTGKKAMYMPTTGGRFPKSAYAIPCGICMIATVRPEITSDNMFFLQLYLLSHLTAGTVDAIQAPQLFNLMTFIAFCITAEKKKLVLQDLLSSMENIHYFLLIY